jgi:GTP-binding protein
VSNLIAIVGRPNVGKSALFNRIVKKRIAIVHDQPGVTRDRVSVEAEWNGKSFTLVDTGGIGLLRREKSDDVIVKAALEQVEIAIEAASAIILVVNVQDGIVPLDREVAQKLRGSAKPILVAVNKVDTHRLEGAVTDFSRLGFEKIFPVSAIHGEGIQNLMDAATAFLPAVNSQQSVVNSMDDADVLVTDHELMTTDSPEIEPRKKGPLRLAIVGRPNVGKSSIINALTKSERVIVSPIPGTTRDAVDVPFEVKVGDKGVAATEKYVLVDTAGIRKTRKIDDSVEFFSVQRSEESIARCDIAILVLDAEAGILEQDKKIADHIVENRRACILVVNKWDLFEEKIREKRKEEIVSRGKKENRSAPKIMTTLGEFGAWVQEKLFFLDYAPVIFTSAKSGFHLDRLLEAVRYVAAQLQQKVPTAILNRTLRDSVEKRQPVTPQGHRLKFFYATQVRQVPPTFLLFVNRDELFSDQYKKYLGGELRRAFGYEGCPIVIVPKARPKTVEPIRKFKPAQNKALGRADAHRAARHERYSRKPKKKSR